MHQLGQKVGLDELEETLDLASPFRVVGRTEDTLDTEGGANGVQVL